MTTSQQHDPKLARTLILDELFDLSLYKALREITDRGSQKVLDELILVETQHLAFWQKFFDSKLTTLDLGRRLKLRFFILVCRIFGTTAVHLALEAIEVHGVRKYLSLWKAYKDGPLGNALQGILLDEFKHEDVLVTQLTERKINPEKIRNIFLGLNDGLVEILGAVSGFFGAFGDAVTVLIAASTTAVAGSLSMGAGAYGALNSEKEVKATQFDKKQFLGEETGSSEMEEQPFSSAVVVGCSYFAGAMVPVLPVLLGATNALFSLVAAGSMVILVSTLLAFLSGMNIRRRILLNLIIIAAAVGITYAIGLAANALWGVSVP
ncbi:MAG: VIT1/CCC1 transporter family protein [Nitrospiraceae bacterium]